MESAAGSGGVSDDVSSLSIDGMLPELVVSPGNVQTLALVMAGASEERVAVVPVGGGTRLELGNPIRRFDVAVDISRLDRVLQHNPADLTVTVEAGIAVASLQRTLAKHGQFLALDPPLPDRATIGGTLAVGVGGPMKYQFGNPRDLVIGMKVVHADGTTTKSGGQVVKNVSGYDMSRLHIGGLGTLGVIAEVSFRLAPLPRSEATVVATFGTTQHCSAAALGIFDSQVVPMALTCFDRPANERANVLGDDGGYFLAVRLGGRPRTLERQVQECSRICREHGATTVESLESGQAVTVWRTLADFGWDPTSRPTMAARASVAPTRILEVAQELERSGLGTGLIPAIVAHPAYGTVLISWFADEDLISEDVAGDTLGQARDSVHKAGGHMTVERCLLAIKTRIDVWDEAGAPLDIMRSMKEQYDPSGILNPGRFVGGI